MTNPEVPRAVAGAVGPTHGRVRAGVVRRAKRTSRVPAAMISLPGPGGGASCGLRTPPSRQARTRTVRAGASHVSARIPSPRRGAVVLAWIRHRRRTRPMSPMPVAHAPRARQRVLRSYEREPAPLIGPFSPLHTLRRRRPVSPPAPRTRPGRRACCDDAGREGASPAPHTGGSRAAGLRAPCVVGHGVTRGGTRGSTWCVGTSSAGTGKSYARKEDVEHGL